MEEARSAQPNRTSGAAAVARNWVGALGRLLLFGVLFVALVEIIAVLTFPLDRGGMTRIAWGGFVWLTAALIASAITMRALDRRSWRALGLGFDRIAARATIFGLAFGVVLIVIAVALMLATGDLAFTRDAAAGDAASAVLGSFAALALPAAAEEAIFRGYPIQVLTRVAGAPLAVLTTSAAFAAVHADNPAADPLALANIFLAGVLLAVVYLRTGSLWAATAVHLGWNWGMAGLFDLPVSGLAWIDVPGFEPVVSGPAWWNGAAFGPEGGVIGTIVFVAATVFALRTGWFTRTLAQRPEHRMLHDESLNEGS